MEESAESHQPSGGIVVLGMHRSGTSLITQLVSALGFEAGDNLLPAAAGNPRGFWENRELARIHERFLVRIGFDWTYPGPLPSASFEGPEAMEARAEIGRVLDRDLLHHHRWVVKDPRLCRLLPLWKPLLDRPGLGVRYLLVLRSPAEVAASLERRDLLSRPQSHLLWLRHVLEGERSTRGEERRWIELDSFVDRPLVVARDLASWLGHDREIGTADLEAKIDAVYDRGLIHPGVDSAARAAAAAFPWLDRVDAALRRLAEPGEEPVETLAALDAVDAELDRCDAMIAAGVAEATVGRQRDEALRRCAALAQRSNELRGTIDRIRASRSWRWTRPSRDLMAALRGLRAGGETPGPEAESAVERPAAEGEDQ